MPTLVFQSLCPHCQNEYDGRDVEVGQEILCPFCDERLLHHPKLGHFILLRPLGQGGMCTVYLAQDTKNNEEVALKLLKKSLAKDSESVLRFFDEAETTEIFKHPNVIRLYEFGEQAGTLYLSMEYLRGGSLDDLMVKQGKMGELQVLEVGIAAAKGLAHASARGVVHRDVKPGNILFKATSEATVTDFGLSSKQTDLNPNTQDVWGTAYYVPPERLLGEAEDFRSDMFGLGASLYHALTGAPAYWGKTFEEILASHASAQMIPVREHRPDVSRKTAAVIEKATAVKPEQRYRSYELFIDALEEARRDYFKKNWRSLLLTRTYWELAGRKLAITFFSLLFVLAGVFHFLTPDPFVEIVPAYLPSPLLLVQVSGFFEILGGIGLLFPITRQWAGCGLMLLLLAVLPANMYMLTDHPYILQTHIPRWVLILRIPLQFVLILAIFWATWKKRNIK